MDTGCKGIHIGGMGFDPLRQRFTPAPHGFKRRLIPCQGGPLFFQTVPEIVYFGLKCSLFPHNVGFGPGFFPPGLIQVGRHLPGRPGKVGGLGRKPGRHAYQKHQSDRNPHFSTASTMSTGCPSGSSTRETRRVWSAI